MSDLSQTLKFSQIFSLRLSSFYENSPRNHQGARPGRSGNPQSSGRVVQVFKSLGNENCYPKTAPKNHYPQVWVPANSGSGIPDIPEIYKIIAKVITS
jgi:hypothetical protein